MDADLIYELAFEFRCALDIVVRQRKYGRLTIFANFPNGCCRYTSDLLAEYLIEMGIKRERIQMISGEANYGSYSHVWLMIDDLYFVDITADQFSNKQYFNKYSPISACCVMPKGTYFYEQFANQKIQSTYNVGIRTYSGDTPERLQVVYNAVVEQILNN